MMNSNFRLLGSQRNRQTGQTNTNQMMTQIVDTGRNENRDPNEAGEDREERGEYVNQNIMPTQAVSSERGNNLDFNYQLSQHNISVQITQDLWSQSVSVVNNRPKGNAKPKRDMKKLKEMLELKITMDMRNEYDIVNKPTLKLTQHILNSLTHEPEIYKTYYITPFGMKQSERESTDSLVKFGRMTKDEEGNIINDITFPRDNTVSRSHCRIEISDGFKRVEPLPENWLALFMMTHPRLGSNLTVPSLNGELIFNILSYTGKKREFSIVDCGSTTGTYIKIKHNLSHVLKKYFFFLLGCDIFITIKEIITEEQCSKPNFNLVSRLLEDCKNSKIVGDIPQDLASFLSSSGEEISQTTKNEILQKYQDFRAPYIKLDTHKFNAQGQPLSHVLIFSESKSNFSIGRAAFTDVIIEDSTISREQSRIFYSPKEKKWLIKDGSEMKESLNGTWLSINNSLNQYFKNESDKFPLKHDDIFKISDSIFKVEELNIHKYYNM